MVADLRAAIPRNRPALRIWTSHRTRPMRDLAAIVPEGDIAVLFLQHSPEPPEGWQLLRGGTAGADDVARIVTEQPSLADSPVSLGHADFPRDGGSRHADRTGPFRAQTASLGGFSGFGRWPSGGDGWAAIVSGRFHGVSAVCSHPDFRGRGYAQALVARLPATFRTPAGCRFSPALRRIRERFAFISRWASCLAVPSNWRC